MKLQVLVLAAGDYIERTTNTITRFPRNLQDINSDPQILKVLNNIKNNIGSEFDLIVCLARNENQQFFTDSVVLHKYPKAKIVSIPQNVHGALATALLAVDEINLQNPLLVVNADQIIEHKLDSFLQLLNQGKNAGILAFKSNHPRWSYVNIENNQVIEVVEKRPISNLATAGTYLFQSGEQFLDAARKSILRGNRTSEKYFVAPIMNEIILQNESVGIQVIQSNQYYSLSTEYDLSNYRSHLAKEL